MTDALPDTLVQEAMDLVDASPRLVGEGDKAGWLCLFAVDARVEDPKGTLQLRGLGAPGGHDWLARFWDVFIAPNEIRFEVLQDAVLAGGRREQLPACGVEIVVIRRVDIHTGLSFGAQLVVPSVLRYTLRREAGTLLIGSLEAFWNVKDNVVQGLAQGPRGWMALTAQGWRMLRHLGLSGTLRYAQGLLRAPGLAGAPPLP